MEAPEVKSISMIVPKNFFFKRPLYSLSQRIIAVHKGIIFLIFLKSLEQKKNSSSRKIICSIFLRDCTNPIKNLKHVTHVPTLISSQFDFT